MSPYPKPAVFLDRILKRADFISAYRYGIVAVRPCIVMQMRPWSPEEKKLLKPAQCIQAGESWARVGFTASRKVGNAVTRNRARRRLKEAAVKILPHQAPGECDYVWIARPTVAHAAWPVLIADAQRALTRLLVLGARQQSYLRSR